ncbi:MAG: ferritin-like domain-containing protein [Candidatus Methanomethylicaceae archaeon]
MCRGLLSETVSKVLEEIAITEMKHYEKIVERIDYLGGIPTTKPAEIKLGKNIQEMLEFNKKAEEEAISLQTDNRIGKKKTSPLSFSSKRF